MNTHALTITLPSKSAASILDAADMAILRGDEFCGKDVTEADIHARGMLLCHDQYDRSCERFPLAYLEQFAKTAPGKSVLACHNSGGWTPGDLPLGRFYKAAIDSRIEEGFPVLTRNAKDSPIPGFEAKRKKVNYLSTGFYFVNDESTEALRKNIDLGVFKHVSIGFVYDDVICDICGKSYLEWGANGCPHYRGEVLDDGRVCTLTYGGDVSQAEMREGSIVYLGAQPKARLVKAIESGEGINPEKLALTPYGLDLIVLKEAECHAQGHNKGKAYAHGLKEAFSTEGVSLENELSAALAAVESAAKRFADYRALKAKDERPVSADRISQLKALSGALSALVSDVDAPEPASGLGLDLDRRALIVSKRAQLLLGQGAN